MRKFWYAGAVVAGGIFLFGAAAPAQADLLPGTGTAEQQADEQLANLLGRSNGATVENPLRHSTLGNTPLGAPPLLDVAGGNNGTDLKPALTGESADDPRPNLPAADVVSGALSRPIGDANSRNVNVPQLNGMGGMSVGDMPMRSVFSGIPLFSGLLPDGGTPSAVRPTTPRQAEAFRGGVPLLGGLGGLLPVNGLPTADPVGEAPDTSGLPAGGLAVIPAAATGQAPAEPAADDTPKPAASDPAKPAPATSSPAEPAADETPTPAATPDDPRLHEEPIDGEARRDFSPDGRPVAGIDEQYK
ncbi:hypothetical protein [Paractinoplanes toevensis]|uniref:Uncharacterized protein n=1 Tax=Paractinoplanes toevensis TaxID=571911 RepID=A0A919TDH0_9ACTN|nr:hypothetical protein [Actinoplanes toevensis]GIM93525.1 hypothetical protein Ato02nite_053180 [Actinoplanes toevensis]